MTIEPTDEMVKAVEASTIGLNDSARRRMVVRVLAIVERDYELLPYCNAELMPGVVCKLSSALGHSEHRAKMPTGNPVAWS